VIQNIPLYGEMHRFIPALASWYGAEHLRDSDLESGAGVRPQPLWTVADLPVFFDLLTIRFLLRYMTRPLHFFGGIGSLGVITGSDWLCGCWC